MSWNDGLEGVVLNIAGTNETPLRVIAGPGTGKTYAMMHRVARLLEEGNDPKRILAVTFTRTAANDLKNELRLLGVSGSNNIVACTLHSLCFRMLLKQSVLEYIGRYPRPLIVFNKSGVLQYEGALLLQDIGDSGHYGNKRNCTKRILAFESAWARLQSDTPGWPTDTIDREFHDELTKWLVFHNAILIGELIPEALRYLRNNPESEELRSYDYIIVDEYQDLNRAEQELLDILTRNTATSIIGDGDQSIYSFRYAHPEGINEYHSSHPGTHDEILIECRRCPRRIVILSNEVIKNNHASLSEEKLVPYPTNQEGEVHIVQWLSLEEEIEGLSKYVQNLIINKNEKPGDILILSPRRLIGYQIKAKLRELNIPTHSYFNEEYLEHKESQQAFSLLALLVNQEDRPALRYWLGYGNATLNKREYGLLRAFCENNGLSPREAIAKHIAGEINIGSINKLVQRYNRLIDQLNLLRPLRGSVLLNMIFPETEIWAAPFREAFALIDDEDLEAEDLFSLFRENITQPEMPQEGNYVRIMSLHKSKGLTCKNVVIVGCIQGLIPMVDRSATIEERNQMMQEQRRLFYVAITRCKASLVLSSATRLDRRLAHKIGAMLGSGGGRNGATIASQFISELGINAPQPKRGEEWIRNGYL